MSAHTPGPWEVGQDDSELEPAIMAGDYYVATAHFGMKGDESMGQDMAIANAHLIAAAPDLLAHIKVMMEVHCPQPGPECGVCEHARALVSNAEGKS